MARDTVTSLGRLLWMVWIKRYIGSYFVDDVRWSRKWTRVCSNKKKPCTGVSGMGTPERRVAKRYVGSYFVEDRGGDFLGPLMIHDFGERYIGSILLWAWAMTSCCFRRYTGPGRRLHGAFVDTRFRQTVYRKLFS